MAVSVTHTFTSLIADDPAAQAAGDVLPSHWNAAHTISGLPSFVSSSVDNTIPRFDGTSGNFQTSGVTIDDNDVVIIGGALSLTGATGSGQVSGAGYNLFAQNGTFKFLASYVSSTDFLDIKHQSTTLWQVASTGHILAGTDASYDIGASGASRPRNLWLAGGCSAQGDITAVGALTSYSYIQELGGLGYYSRGNSSAYRLGAADDVVITRDAANTLALRNSTSAQTFNVYNTWTDVSNYERLSIGYVSNVATINSNGLGTGVNRSLRLIAGNSTSSNGGVTIDQNNTYGHIALTTADGSSTSSGWYDAGYTAFGAVANQKLTFFTNNTLRWNISATGHILAETDNSYDIGAAGATRPRNIYAGTAVTVGQAVNTLNLVLGNGLGSIIRDASDGVITLLNDATTDFGRLQFGGTTSSFPALRRTGTQIDVILADAGDYAPLYCKNFGLGGGNIVLHSTVAGLVQFSGTTSSFPAIKRSSATLAFRLADDSADADISARQISASNVVIATQGLYLGNSNTYMLQSYDGANYGLDMRLSGGSNGVTLYVPAADVLEQRRSTNAQTYNVYNTYTDASNYEKGTVGWSGNIFKVTSIGAGTGNHRPMTIGPLGSAYLSFQTNGADRWYIDANGHFLGNVDNSYDIGASGATRPRNIYFGTTLFGGVNLKLNGDGANRQALYAGTNLLQIGDDFANISLNTSGLVRFVGSTSSYPALKRNSTGIDVRLADDSGYAPLTASTVTATSLVGALTGNADTVTIANEASDTTCFVLFSTATSGSLAPKTNSNLAFNSNTGVLTLTAPVLGTPTSGTLTNCSGLPISGIASLGTGVATALAVNVGSAGAPVTFNGALGTPSSGTLTNCTAFVGDSGSGGSKGTVPAPAAGDAAASKFLKADGTWAALVGGGNALTSSTLAQFAATTSAQLAGVISDETGSNKLVFSDSPTLVTPLLGTPTSGNLSNCTALPVSGITASTSTAIGVGSVELGHASDTTIARVAAGIVSVEGTTVPLRNRGHIWGLKMSNAADTNNDITVAAGEARDETGVRDLVLAASITKQMDAAWAVGTNAGGMNTGAEANSTWYEVHLIMRSDTGVVDVMFTTTANRATLPANYDYQRRIGWIRNDSGGALLQFTQVNDHITLTTQINDASVTATATAAQLTMTVPPNAIGRFRTTTVGNTSVNTNMLVVFSEIVEGNVTPADTTGIGTIAYIDLASSQAGHFDLRVDGSSQIEHDSVNSTGSPTFDISTYGWIDDRLRHSAT